jgi:hypothetical protein
MLDAALVDITRTPPLIGGPLFGALFYWLTTALGDRLLRLGRVPLTAFTVWERGLLCAAIGTGSLQFVPLALASLGQLYPLQIQVALGVITALLWRDLRRVARRAIAEIKNLPLRPASPAHLIWFLLFSLFMGVWLVHAVTFGPFGDDDGIHLAAPKRWLAAGTLSYLPTYSLTNASMGFDLIYLIAMAVWSPVGAKMLHYIAGLFALLTLVLAARRVSSATAGLLAVSVMLIGTPVSNLPVNFGNAMIDLASCWLTLTSVLIWLVWRDTRDPKLLMCMAACAGFAASFKLTSVQVAIAWTPVLIAELRRKGETWPTTLRLVLAFGVVAGLAVIPWFIRNLVLTGNPLYPMLTSLIPTRDWSPEHAEVFSRYTKYYAWGVSAGPSLDESARKNILMAAIALVGAASGLATLFLRTWVARALLAFSAVFVMISLVLTGLIFRYWLPATMCLALAVATTLDRHRFRRGLVWVASALLIVALGVQARRGFYFHSGVGLAGDLRMAVGLSTFEEEYAGEPLVQVWRYLNQHTPPDAQILFGAFYTTFGASSYAGFWVDRMCYTTDSHLQTFFRLDDWTAFEDSIDRAGITHVVVAKQQFNPTRHGFTFTAGQNEFPFVRRLVSERGDKVLDLDLVEIYRIRRRPAVRSPGDSATPLLATLR